MSMQLIAEIRGGCRRKSIFADRNSPSSISQATTLLAMTAVIHMATADRSTLNLHKSPGVLGDACVKNSNQNCPKLEYDYQSIFDCNQSAAAFLQRKFLSVYLTDVICFNVCAHAMCRHVCLYSIAVFPLAYILVLETQLHLLSHARKNMFAVIQPCCNGIHPHCRLS